METLAAEIQLIISKHKIKNKNLIYFYKGLHAPENACNPYETKQLQNNKRPTWNLYYSKLWNFGRSIAAKYNYFDCKIVFDA